MTKAQVIALIDQYITTNGNQEITGAQTNSVMKALANQDLPFADITNKPTTLSGYGITNAYTKGQSDSRYVDVTGDTMTGALTVGGDITIPNTSWLKDTGGNSLIRATSGGFVNVGGDNVTNPTAITLYANSEVRLKNLVPLKDDAGYEWMNMTSGGFLRIGYQNPGAITLFGGSSPRYNNGTSNYDLWHQGNLRSNSQNDSRYVQQTRTISTGTGLTGGGNLSANRTINVIFGTSAGTVMQGNSAYTKAEADGKYLLNTSDVFTGTLTFDNTSAGGINTVGDNQRLRIGGGTQWSSSNGAYISIEGINYSGSGSGGNINLNPTEGKLVNITRGLSVNNDLTVGGNVTATGFYESSDIRLKENIQPLNYGLKEIEKIDTHTWNWKKDGAEDIGVIAQELETILPELVKTNEEGYKSVNYTKLVPILINSIKELSNQVKALKNG